MTQSLSVREARKIVLYSQCLDNRRHFGSGTGGTLEAIEHLGYVQLDTLSVVERAHHHTLWNRLGKFQPLHIDQLQREGQIFEHWAHALALLPMKDYRYSLPMMNRIAAGDIHWSPKNTRETKNILERIKAEGALQARDFGGKRPDNKMWSRSPSKRALEQLFIEGELMIPYRINFRKVYDLRERVLPTGVDTSVPSEEELCRHLITSFLRAHGLGSIKEMNYLRKGIGPAMRRTAKEMEEDGLVVPIEIKGKGKEYFSTPSTLALQLQNLPRSSLRILSPFDNAIIQRNRVNKLFDFDFQIECYVKKDKRRFGYFCLPILHRNSLVGRIDAKADRKRGVLLLYHLQLETSITDTDAVLQALNPELKRFAVFNGCDTLQLCHYNGNGRHPDFA